MAKKSSITVEGKEISLYNIENKDYFSLSDMCRENGGIERVRNWMRNRDTIEFLSTWEEIHNPDFNLVQMHQITKEAGLNRFIMSPQKWIETTNAIGLVSRRGRHGGIYAHKDIAYHFAMWLSPRFSLLVIKELDRLKTQEYNRQQLEWDSNRFLAKRNYYIHTDAIKHILLPSLSMPQDENWLVYAEEADLLYVAVFGHTAKTWREANPPLVEKGENMRDQASNEQLIILSNLEAINAELIRETLSKKERFWRLQQIAIYQLEILSRKRLE